jgi:hypothetical protein
MNFSSALHQGSSCIAILKFRASVSFQELHFFKSLGISSSENLYALDNAFDSEEEMSRVSLSGHSKK